MGGRPKGRVFARYGSNLFRTAQPPPRSPRLTITDLHDSRLRALLDPRRLVRWGYLARLTVAGALFAGVASQWQRASAADTLIVALACIATLVVTAIAALWSEVWRKPLLPSFRYGQVIFDLLLASIVVHLTGGFDSQFAGLYILVIVNASLLLPGGGALLVAALGLVFYLGDGLILRQEPVTVTGWLQFAVLASVALCSAYVGARLQEVGTGQEELAAELVHARLQASDILHNIKSGIVTLDARGRLLYANPAASTLLGLPLTGATGRLVLASITQVAPELGRALERAIEEGIRTNRAEGSLTRNGRTYPVGVTTTLAEHDERGVTVTAIFQDLSESKRLEALHLRAERLEAVAELSASLAHEIKNPLASIRSAVEQLAGMPWAGEDERTLGSLIVRESDRLARLLSEFLDFARVRVTRVVEVDLGAVAREAAALAASHPDRGRDVLVRCATPHGAVVIEGDEDLLHRAIFNLALNAVQAVAATGNEGEVTVEVALVERDALPAGMMPDTENGGTVTVKVCDTGPGIPPEVRDRLFDPFITTKPGGTGLGLPVVHRAIEAHRGVVFVDSDATGTRFTAFLPVRQHAEHATPASVPKVTPAATVDRLSMPSLVTAGSGEST